MSKLKKKRVRGLILVSILPAFIVLVMIIRLFDGVNSIFLDYLVWFLKLVLTFLIYPIIICIPVGIVLLIQGYRNK